MKKRLYIGVALGTMVALMLGVNIYSASKSSQSIYVKNATDKEPFYEQSYKQYLDQNNYNGKMSSDTGV